MSSMLNTHVILAKLLKICIPYENCRITDGTSVNHCCVFLTMYKEQLFQALGIKCVFFEERHFSVNVQTVQVYVSIHDIFVIEPFTVKVLLFKSHITKGYVTWMWNDICGPVY